MNVNKVKSSKQLEKAPQKGGKKNVIIQREKLYIYPKHRLWLRTERKKREAKGTEREIERDRQTDRDRETERDRERGKRQTVRETWRFVIYV